MGDVSCKKKIIDYIRVVGVFVSSIMLFFCLTYELCEEFQTPKDRYYYAGIIWSLILIAFLRNDLLKKIEVWIVLIMGTVAFLTWVKIEGINSENYGEFFSKVMLYTRIIWLLFFVLGVDLIRNRYFLWFLKKNWIKMLIFNSIIVLIWFYNRKNLYPLFFPLEMMVLTKMDAKKWHKLIDILVSAFIVVLYFFSIRSFIMFPTRFEEGRYMGQFISVENLGSFSGIGILCAIYIYYRIKNIFNSKLYYYLAPILLFIYSSYLILITESRIAMAGVIVVFIALFFFGGKRNNIKQISKKMIIFVGASACAIASLPLLGKMASNSGPWRVGNYFRAHLATLDPGSRAWSGYFGDYSVLNAINAFSSHRLEIYDMTLREISLFGHQMDYSISPHNFFIQKLIEFGWIPGMIYILWIAFCVVLMIKRCVKREGGVLFPLIWSVYSIVVLSGTILSLHSILATGLFMFLTMIFFDKNRESEFNSELKKTYD